MDEPRMSWLEAEILAQLVKERLDGEKYLIGGSYLRHCHTCGNLDVLVFQPTIPQRLDALRECFAEGVLNLVVCTNILCWGAAATAIAGDWIYFSMLKKVASSKGMFLTPESIRIGGSGDIIACTTERGLYSMLGMAWRDYVARSIVQK